MKSILAFLLIFLFLGIYPDFLSGQTRTVENISQNWSFKGGSIFGDSIRENVNLPHTWNNKDAQAGFEYYRGIGEYAKKLFVDKAFLGKRLFLKFGGVHTVADVSLNGKTLGQHRGGYSAFVYEITSQVKIGEENLLVVKVDNRKYDDILPLGGDFNQYGGIYRPVFLIVTDQVCVTPLDYGSPGVYIEQTKISDKEADINILCKLSNGSSLEQSVSVAVTVFDQQGVPVVNQNANSILPAGGKF